MFTKIFKLLVIICNVFLPSQAFWWRSSSTESPPPSSPVMKHIPLTYFRTYTYQQPLVSNPIDLPLLSSTDYITNYNALNNLPYFNSKLPIGPISLAPNNDIEALEPRPVKSFNNFHLVRSLGPIPADTTVMPESTTTTTTTTSTTTTTPEPTTTTSTEPPTTLQIDTSSSANPSIQSGSLDNLDTSHPAFNHRAFTNHFNINYNRPVYPYPDYSVYKPSAAFNLEKNKGTSNIEFVPCMCTVNMPNVGFPSAYQAGLPIAENSPNSIFLAQGRTSLEAEAANSVNDLEAFKFKEENAATAS